MNADPPDGSVLLCDLASVVRSKNAGPFEFTIDLMFDDETLYRHVVDANVVTRELIRERYGVADDHIVFLGEFDAARAIKITMVRQTDSGGIGDRDINACQQHAPLLDVRVPAPPGSAAAGSGMVRPGPPAASGTREPRGS